MKKKIVSDGSKTGILKGLFIRNLSDIMVPYWYAAGNFRILIIKIRKTVVFLLPVPSAQKQFIIQVSDLSLGPYLFLIFTINRIRLKKINVFRMYFDKKNCFVSVIFYLYTFLKSAIFPGIFILIRYIENFYS